MSGIIRAPRPARGWTEIPDSTIRDKRLSYRARGVLVRLLSNAEGYRMTAEDLAREGREGRGAVLAALRELREAGYLVVRRVQGSGGRWRTETYVYDYPQAVESTEVGFPDFGFPDSGEPDSGFPDSNKNNQQNDQKQQQHARARAHARARDAALPPAVSGGGAAAAISEVRRWRVRPSGIVAWTGEDDAEAARLEASASPEEVAAAVQAVRAASLEPLPGRVWRELARLRRARETQERLQERLASARALEVDAAAVARGQALLHAVRRRRHAEAAAC